MKWILITFLSTVFAQQTSPNCAQVPGTCNQAYPCCSKFGFCGSSDAHCGAGCQQVGNFAGVFCKGNQPTTNNPINNLPSFGNGQCRSGFYTFSPSRLAPARSFNGDNQAFDFTVDGSYALLGSTLQLRMAAANQGATVRTTRYVRFGRITAVMKTSHTNGVVSSFITQSDDLDEIDFEWVGSQRTQLQTNWFPKGVFPPWPQTNAIYHNGPDSYAGFNSYTIDWNKDRIIWLVNNNPIRTLYAANTPGFPTTPARIGLGIWDGGSGAVGTREWAGGFVNFNGPDIQRQGFYDVQIQSLDIQCY